jgi:hypothetical protein
MARRRKKSAAASSVPAANTGLRISRGSENKVGSLAFLLGAAIAIVGGVVYRGSENAYFASALIALGLLVGILNVNRSETTKFLIASVSLVLMTSLSGVVLGQVALIGQYLEGVTLAILTFVVPAGIVVALKSVYELASD